MPECEVDGVDVDEPETNFSVTRRLSDGHDVVEITGELDLWTSPRLSKTFAECGDDVEVDCTGMTFVDSVGLGALVAFWRQEHERGGELSLTHIGPSCWHTLLMAGVVDLLHATPQYRE
jgi:anti-anti-sigma factor